MVLAALNNTTYLKRKSIGSRSSLSHHEKRDPPAFNHNTHFCPKKSTSFSRPFILCRCLLLHDSNF